MKRNTRTFTIRQSFVFSFFLPAILVVLMIIGALIFSLLYASTANNAFMVAGTIYTITFIILYVVTSLLTIKTLRRTYYDGLYKATSSLLKNLRENNPSEIRYPVNSKIKEFKELNDDLDKVNSIAKHSTLISDDLSSIYPSLDYISKEDNIVTLESFKGELRNLIYCSQNFRNVIVELFYDLEEDIITEEETKRIIEALKDAFNGYKNILFIPNDSSTGFYIFLPHINSFSHIKERLVAAMKHISVNKKTFDGLVTINARFAVVCYPYSNIDELFPDLLFAKRQGKIINLYLPNRMTALSETKIMQNSLNLNNMSRVLEKLSALSISLRKRGEAFEIIKDTFRHLCTYLDIDNAGVITFDDVSNCFTSTIAYTSLKEPIFKEGTVINKEFIDVLEDARDPDDSYYFSSRAHAVFMLAKCLDKINVSGGFYYIVHDGNKIISVIYFFNHSRDLIIDSYIRETMFILSYRIGDFFIVTHDEDKLGETYREINGVLMSSDYAIYRINRHNYCLEAFSSHFKTYFPNAEIGEKCYKALYGLDAPCSTCPLKTQRKMISKSNNNNFETSLTINNSKMNLIRLLVKHVKFDDYSGDLFDKDLLINSFNSLVNNITNLYAINSRGYMLVLHICNKDSIISEAGSEGYLYLLRQLIRNIQDIKYNNAFIYSFTPNSVALLLPELGQIDIVNLIEKIYDLSKLEYEYNSAKYSFDVSYLPYSFPQQFPSSNDFVKHAIRHYTNFNVNLYKDMIFFEDGEYSRSASRNQFMLSVIEEQFGNKTFSVALQPMVRASDKSIYGAELLIRLSDTYRNFVFNADELIKVAAQNGKISLISNALLKYIGELYQQHGLTIFKVFGFTRLTMNTDFSYFDDPDFFNSIFELCNEYHIPRDFLGFEITEKEIYQHLDKFKGVAKGILNQHIALIVDQYSGEFLSMDVLKSLGFTEIKIGRKLVGDIEVNSKHLAEITSIDKLAVQNDLIVTFVGVENSEQYVLLRDLDKKCHCQGYHFYKPLDEYKLIEELRKNN